MGRERPLTRAVVCCCALLLVVLGACTGAPAGEERADGPAAPSPASPPSASTEPAVDFSVADPGPFEPPLLTADVLITSTAPIPGAVQRRIRRLDGVRAAIPMSMAKGLATDLPAGTSPAGSA